ATCPKCGALLRWTDDRFACSTGDFVQPETPNRLDGDDLVLAGDVHVPLRLALPREGNRWNAAPATPAAAPHLGVDPLRAAHAAATVDPGAGRYMRAPLADGRRARVFLAKTPAGWSEVLHWVADAHVPTVIAVNARVADGKDPSWLWDVPYELLRGLPAAAAGERALDVAVRLKYADVEHIVEHDPLAAAARLPGDGVDIVASYTQFSALYRRYG